MSMIEGFMAKFDSLCDEICALRERVEALESVTASVKIQTATGAKSVAQSAPAPAPAQTTTVAPATRTATTAAKSAAK